MVTFGDAINQVMGTYLKYPPRKVQAANIPYITLPQYQLLMSLKDQLQKEGFKFSIPVEKEHGDFEGAVFRIPRPASVRKDHWIVQHMPSMVVLRARCVAFDKSP